jgi:hypothetical protein
MTVNIFLGSIPRQLVLQDGLFNWNSFKIRYLFRWPDRVAAFRRKVCGILTFILTHNFIDQINTLLL